MTIYSFPAFSYLKIGMREELAFLAKLFLVITLLKSQVVLLMIKELNESKGKIPPISPPSCSVLADFTSEEAPYCSKRKYFLSSLKRKSFLKQEVGQQQETISCQY